MSWCYDPDLKFNVRELEFETNLDVLRVRLCEMQKDLNRLMYESVPASGDEFDKNFGYKWRNIHTLQMRLRLCELYAELCKLANENISVGAVAPRELAKVIGEFERLLNSRNSAGLPDIQGTGARH